MAARAAGWLVGSGELPDRRTDLSADPLLLESLAAGAHQAAVARPLGYLAGSQPRLRAAKSADPAPRSGFRANRRPRTRRTSIRGQRLPRGHVLRGLPGGQPRPRRAAPPGPAVLRPWRDPRSRERSDAWLDPRRRRGSGMRWCTRSAPRSTTRISSSSAWSATERPRRLRWRTVERRPIPQPGARRRRAAGAASQRGKDLRPHGLGTGRRGRRRREPASDAPVVVAGTIRTRFTATSRSPSTRQARRSPRSSAAPVRTVTAAGPRGPQSSCARRRDGPGRAKSTVSASRAHSARTGRTAAVRENAGHLALLEEWMRTYRPDERFDDDARLVAEPSARSRRGQANRGDVVRERRSATSAAGHP